MLHNISTGSGSDRVSFAISGTSHNDPVSTAPGTDLNLKLGHYPHGLHNPDLSALATVDIRREIEQFGILP